jgi:RNA polymerase sigma-70 factor (ECF subfamily)
MKSASPVWRGASSTDRDAFRDLVATYDARVNRVCLAVCGDPDVAADAAQQTWCTVWRKLGSVRDEDRLVGWLTVVAANEARQLQRSARRRRVRERLARVFGAGQDLPSPASTDLGSALAQLDPRDQAVLVMRYVEGMSSDEVGQALGMPAPTVRTRTRRLLARLREELGDDVRRS